ncbi:hypothetical protein ACIOJE_35020 [Kitasatospora sp. NPDC087861]|uniref:hypothetical protein n=1 Tax=Kitasatospora sp. NPDC087861 TaxID=3364070 RepID=UPI0037FD96EA
MTLAAVHGPSETGPDRLAELLEATSPEARSRQAGAEVLPVLEPLRPLLPHGGLARGTVTVAPDLGTLLALAAGPASADRYGYTAVIGLPELGMAAAAEYGLDLARVLVVDEPGAHYAEVVSTLAAACPVIIAAGHHQGLPARAADRLAAHLRRAGTVVLTPGPWPGAHLRVDTRSGGWEGLGDGWGQLDRRRVELRVVGRGSAGRERRADLWLPDADGGVSVLAENTAVTTETPAVASA